jgi:hypothetical protein
MKRRVRWLAWVGVALCVLAVAFGLTVRLVGLESPGVTEANAKRIQPGMALREVEGILGGRGRPLSLPWVPGSVDWSTKGLTVIVVFSLADERVEEIRILKFGGPEPGILDRLRSWFGGPEEEPTPALLQMSQEEV